MLKLSQLEVADTQDKLSDMFSYLGSVSTFAFDFETRSRDYTLDPNGALDKMRMMPDLFSASTDERLFVVPIGMVTQKCVTLQEFIDGSKEVMEDPTINHDGWNFAYDCSVFANIGIWVKTYRDWMVAAALLDDNRSKSLKERCIDVGLELHKYDFKKYWSSRDKYLHPNREVFTDTGRVKKITIPTDEEMEDMELEYVDYSAEDSLATMLLGIRYERLLKEEGLWDLFIKLRNPAVRTAFMMERRGIRIDVEQIEAKRAAAAKSIVIYEKEVLSLAGTHFDVTSPKQVGEVLYDKMRLPVKKSTDKGAPSTDAETLSLLGQEGHEIAIALSKHRKVAKINSSYLGLKSKFSAGIKPWEYIHPSYNTVGTRTGRWSSSNPNFMQLPRNTDANYRLREAIIPSDGKVLVGGDLCIAEGQRVRTDHGYIPIEDVKVGMLSLQEDGRYEEIQNIISSGTKEVVEVLLTSGDSLCCTLKHRIRVINLEGDYVFKKVEDIAEGEYVAVSPTEDSKSSPTNKTISLSRSAYIRHHNAREVQIPSELSEDLCEWLGFLVGDGCLTGDSVVSWVVNAGTPEIMDRMMELCFKLFGITPSLRRYRSIIEARFKCIELHLWLKGLGYSKHHLPPLMFKAPTHMVSRFIAGLMEADGCAQKDGRVVLASPRKQLVSDLGRLVHMMGIGRTLRHHRSTTAYTGVIDVYTMSIPKRYARDFASRVGFLSEYKRVRNKKYSIRIGNTSKGSLPNQQNKVPKQSVLFANTRNRGGKISLDLAQKARDLGLDKDIDLNLVLDNNMQFEKIKSITVLHKCPTYDLTIENTHSFICEGFVTHNSQAELRVMADLSQDPCMIEEYMKDIAYQQCLIDGNDPKALGLTLSDIHQLTANACNCTRQSAKGVNFGLIYRMAGGTLARYLTKATWDFKFSEGDYSWDVMNDTITEEIGKDYKDLYFNMYQGVSAYHKLVTQRLQDYGYISTRFGQKRRLPDIYANDNYLRWRAGTQAINACLDEETEALTESGWKNYRDLKIGEDKLLTKNPTTGALEWETLKSLFINTEYTGDRVHLKSTSFDSVSTQDHRWLVDTKRGRLSVCKRTYQLSDWGDDKIHLTGDSYTMQDEDPYCDDFIALAGWFLTDGHLNKNGNSITIMQSLRANPDKVAEIQDLMTRYLKFDGGSLVEWSQCKVWKVRRPETDKLKELFPERKLTTKFILSLTEKHLNLLYVTMMKGDGHYSKESNSSSLCCRDIVEAEMFQLVATLLCKCSRIQKTDTPTGGYYTTHVMARTRAQTTKSMKTVTTGDKWTIWCPEVPNTYFVARRSGKTFVTGNTIQGHVGELVTLCLNKISQNKTLKACGFRLILQVHDEILGECDPEHVEEVSHILSKIFMRPMEPTKARPYHGYRIPMIFAVSSSSNNWSEIH